jgi:hypothetical protein
MNRFAFTLLVALAVAATGIGARHYVQALGPYGLVAVLWAIITIFIMIWHRLSVSAFVSSITISSAICLPIVAYLISQWLGFGVGAVIFYLASKWAEKLKDRSSPNAGQ